MKSNFICIIIIKMNMQTIIKMILSYDQNKRDEINRLKERVTELEDLKVHWEKQYWQLHQTYFEECFHTESEREDSSDEDRPE